MSTGQQPNGNFVSAYSGGLGWEGAADHTARLYDTTGARAQASPAGPPAVGEQATDTWVQHAIEGDMPEEGWEGPRDVAARYGGATVEAPEPKQPDEDAARQAQIAQARAQVAFARTWYSGYQRSRDTRAAAAGNGAGHYDGELFTD